jgi:2-dehydro-3-deoxyglucarate aldolase/4-hydroxy-2-oxoheptanedioate aldolase
MDEMFANIEQRRTNRRTLSMGSRIKEILGRDGIVHVFGIGQLCSTKLIEIVANAGGYDAIWLDQEHTGLTMREIELATLACRAHGLDSFVRVAPTDYATVMQPLEAGAGGVMAAQVRTAAEAEQFVRWAKFHPRGLRGMTGAGVDGKFSLTPQGDYAEQANRDTFVAIQIETIEAVDNISAIAAVKDVDLLFVGPSDLAQALGLTGQFDHPRCYETIERIANACRAAGKPWGIIARNADYATRWVDRGCRFLVLGADVILAQRGISAVKQSFAKYFT